MSDDRRKAFESCIAALLRSVKSRRRHQEMREELLGHLCQAFAEELERGLDEKSACEAAMRRLGNVDELRRDLQKSVPLLERWFYFVPGPKEFVMRQSTKVAGWFMAVVGGIFMFGLAIVMPATAKVANAAHISFDGPPTTADSGQLLEAGRLLKMSLISMTAFSMLLAVSGVAIIIGSRFGRRKIAP